MPSSRAIARAVSGWSPVIITARMPARWQRATASRASGRGGSCMPGEAEKRELALRVRRPRKVVERPLGEGEHAQRVAGEQRARPRASRARPRRRAARSPSRVRIARAALEDHLGRALDERHAARRRRAPHDRSCACGRSRTAGVPSRGCSRSSASRVIAALGRGDEQRALGRVADDPASRPRSRQLGVVARGRRAQQLAATSVPSVRVLLAVGEDDPLGA